MKLLIDTHLLLWAAADELPAEAERFIANESNLLLFSSASIWEVVIKCGLGRSDFSVDPYALYGGLLENGYEELCVAAKHALTIHALPPIHKDPFDRILVSQAISEGVHLLTSDNLVAQYRGPVIFVKN
ncbi:MAG: type II toxin-antitoxin system VapC family toxin [Synergistaceae bacterium]|jgi:PIN domain nuclease of toxin-antitoxin system|nr:type II toxin-antitoxin system VapC family toxin [Synergistaceae bacterium]